ncbi:hypothetical protein MRX96_018923 [Rhipicephalus microplus]
MATLLSQSQQRQPGSNNLYGNNQQTNCHRSDVDCVIARGERGCLRRPCSEWGPVGSVACHPDPPSTTCSPPSFGVRRTRQGERRRSKEGAKRLLTARNARVLGALVEVAKRSESRRI